MPIPGVATDWYGVQRSGAGAGGAGGTQPPAKGRRIVTEKECFCKDFQQYSRTALPAVSLYSSGCLGSQGVNNNIICLYIFIIHTIDASVNSLLIDASVATKG